MRRKPEKINVPFTRIAIAQTIQNFVDNPYYLWIDGCTDEELSNLIEYMEAHDIPVPNIPNDGRKESTKKAIYLVWAALECNNCICALMGCQK